MAETRHITFTIGKNGFAVPIEKVREVISAASIMPIPGGRKPLVGLIPYREGKVLPVFSLVGLLGGKGEEKGDLIVVAGLQGSPVGFRVDRIGGVQSVSEEDDEISPYSGDLKDPENAIAGVLSKSGQDHMLIEIERVLGS